MASRKHILIADDDPGIRFSLSELLNKAGYEVASADDGQAALERLDGTAFDLIITDLDMPRLNGLQMLNSLRASGRATPVILCTASVVMTREIAIAEGATDYIEKPLDPNELLEMIERLTASQQK